MSIYFDNSATTLIDPKVLKLMDEINNDLYANPSAMHRFGFLVEEKIKNATDDFAKIINAKSKEIIWTSGGSESNNLAIFGYVNAHKKDGNVLITTSIEHPSVFKCFKKLEEEGFDVKYLNVDSTGHIDVNELNGLIDDKALFVSIMYVNNEIGSVQNISEIGNIIKKKNPKCKFHVDFVQGFGKYKIDVKKDKIDMLSVSSHKFHGPKGVGVLYKSEDIRISSMILGGEQQSGLRAGTLNAPGIIATGLASKIAYDSLDENVNQIKKIKNVLIDKLAKLDEKYGIITINSKKDETFAPHIISISFKGIRAEVMLHALEDKEIYVSAGSACSSHDKKTSNTLLNIGLNPNLAESTIRVSLGKYNSIDEVDNFICVLDELIPKLRIIK